MPSLPYLYLALVVLFSVLVSLTIWARRPLGWRVAGLVVGSGAILVAYLSLAELLSRPKPVGLELAHEDVREFDVLYADWVEGDGIYVLLRVPDLREPRYYRLPWAIERAQELQQAVIEVSEQGGALRIANPFFEPDIEERERLFYVSPPSPRPLKDGQIQNPLRYDPKPRPESGKDASG